ncbi:MAG: DUF547 domain-containing protein, partial [Gammaproteobacteria bacterium]|nr:DUF547 domain-containing protein [Gammaproteobacteria bacterium]
MKMLYTVFILLALSLSSSFIKAEEPDWENYNQLLKQYVKPGQLNNVNLMTVDYLGIKGDPAFNKLVSQLVVFDTNKLVNKQEKLSFYINAYNVLAIKVVLDHWPVKSIKDVGGLFSSVWKEDAGKINGQMVSLHQIEHEILRKMGEPRIHMSIVCASVSCPDLRNEAYTADRLNEQLDEQSKLFLANTKKGLYIKGNTAFVSKLFDWFEEDFENKGGVKRFIRQYNNDVNENTKIDADIEYDWQLNK